MRSEDGISRDGQGHQMLGTVCTRLAPWKEVCLWCRLSGAPTCKANSLMEASQCRGAALVSWVVPYESKLIASAFCRFRFRHQREMPLESWSVLCPLGRRICQAASVGTPQLASSNYEVSVVPIVIYTPGCGKLVHG